MSEQSTPQLTVSVASEGEKWWVLVRDGKREVARVHAIDAANAYTLKRDFLTFTDSDRVAAA